MFRYIGNKTKLLPALMETIATLVPPRSTVADIMAGTGSVSVALRRENYRVIASDVMTYSRHHLVTQLLFSAPPAFEGLVGRLPAYDAGKTAYESVLDTLNSLPPRKGYFYREFSPDGTPANGCPPRKYFTSENAQKIDAVRETLNDWIAAGLITEGEESVLKHTLIMAVNEVASISGTYGYFLSAFGGSALEPFTLKPVSFLPDANTDHVVLQGFAEELAPSITADLCYIDPPYMKRQYAANYHILETVARGDFPEAIGKSGLRDWWDQHSLFCTRTRIRASFDKVISRMHCPQFLISYSEDGLLSIEELAELLSGYGEVTYRTVGYRRFRSNNSSKTRELNEYLIILTKNRGNG